MRLNFTHAMPLLAFLMVVNAFGDDLNVPAGPHVSTTGRGKITATADRATIELKATGRDKVAANAKNAVEKMIGGLVSGLDGLKVTAAEYSLSGLSLERETDYRDDREVLLGYLAERTVTVTLTDVAKIDPVLQAALKAGISEIGDVTYSISNWNELKQRARGLAVADAKQKAQFLAGQFNACLGDVYSISTALDGDDGTLSEISVTAHRAQGRDTKPEYVPGTYYSGQVDISARLSVIFNLRPGACP